MLIHNLNYICVIELTDKRASTTLIGAKRESYQRNG